jgi:hypothetical protein
VTLIEGRFYRDQPGNVWQAVSHRVLAFLAHYDGDPEVTAFDIVPGDVVNAQSGPLVEVRPTGWEAA